MRGRGTMYQRKNSHIIVEICCLDEPHENTGNVYILHNERETENLKSLCFSCIFSQFIFPIKLIAHGSFLCYSYDFPMFLLQSKGKIQLFLQESDSCKVILSPRTVKTNFFFLFELMDIRQWQCLFH